MIRVFLDANVLFSASNTGSNIASFIRLLIEQEETVTSDFAVEEARRNILLKRPNWTAGLDVLLGQLPAVRSVQFDLPVTLNSKDQPILCTAIRSGCQYLATGDKRDFGHLYGHTVKGVTIISLEKLAELVMRARNQ
jgi:predicted nucleic acid-binding protein